MIEHIPVAAIVVRDRRRQDLGDIKALARNIDTHGLLHPLIIAADNELIAGERRLRACQSLGWTTIDVRRWPDLTDAERREIELAENLDRKDLTAAERSRQMVALAETAAEVLPIVGKTPNGGRPPKDRVSEQAIAERIGIPRQTLDRARDHVAAIDAYPELTPLPQTDALKIAAKLDAMADDERTEARAAVIAHDAATLARLTDRPPLPPGMNPHERAAKDPAVRFQNDLHELWKRLNGVRDYGGIGRVIAAWAPDDKRWLLVEVRRIGELMQAWDAEITEQMP